MRPTPAKLLRSLDWRLALGALLLWALLAVAVAFIAGRSERQHALMLMHSELQSLSRLRVESLARQIDRRRQQVRLLARTPPALGMVRASSNRGLDPEGESTVELWQGRLETIFSAFASTTPDVLQVRLLDVADRGRELIRVIQRKGRVEVLAPPMLQRRGDAAYFRETLRLRDNEVYVSDIELSREYGDRQSPLVPTMRVATPVFAADGKPFAIVLVDLDASGLLATMQTGPDEKQLRVYITDQHGRFLLHPDRDKTIAFEAGRTWRWQDEFHALQSPAGSRKMQLLQNASSQAYAVTRQLRLNSGRGDGRRLTVTMAVTEAPVIAAVATARSNALLAMLGGGLLAALLAFLYQRQRRTLHRRQAELAAIVGSSQDAIIGTDLDGLVSSWNLAAQRMFGYRAEQAIGRPLAELILPEGRIEEDRTMRRLAASGEPVPSFETVRQRQDGSEVAVSLAVTAVATESGGVTGLADTIRDISAQRLAEREVRELNASLECQVEERTRQFERFASLHRAIVADAGYAMLATDLEGAITLCNPAAERMFGYTAEELLGRQTMLLWHDPQELAARAEALSQELHQPLAPGLEVLVAKTRCGLPNQHEWTVIRKDGSRLAVLLVISALRDEAGVLQGFIGMASDISRRQQSRRELLAARDQLSKAAELAELGIWTWRLADDALTWNERMFELYQQPLSLRAQGLHYEHWRSRVHPADVAATEAALMAAVEGRKDYDPQFRIVLPDGRIRHIQAGAYVERDEQGKALCVTGINRDISAQRELETTLRGAKEQADEACAAKAALLANMSHEIRTPMNAILGTLALLQQSRLDATQAEYAAQAEAAGQALLGILDSSPAEAEACRLDPQPFSLEHLLRDLATAVSADAGEQGAELLVSLDPALPAWIVGDAPCLQQVLANLIESAMQSADPGEVLLSVSQLERTDEPVRLAFAVRHTGINMPAELREQAVTGVPEGGSARHSGGNQLGLAISQRLVRQMGGSLEVQRSPDERLSFRFTLECPLAPHGMELPAETPSEAAPSSTAAVPVSRAARARPRALSGLRVLLVEDNPTNQLVARELLLSAGAEVAVANDGHEGVLAVKQADPPFDAVLMDIQMPGMDGHAATREIRRHYGPEQLPIIAMTANAMPADRAAALEAGMNEHVGKPFELAALVSVIQRLSGRAGGAVARAAVAPPGETRPVLDETTALRRFDGNQAIYRQALAKFSSDAPARLAELPATLDQDRGPVLHRLHSLKGLAATIGAEAFAALASEACELLVRGCSPARWLALRGELDLAGRAAAAAAGALHEPGHDQEPAPAAEISDALGRTDLLTLWRLLEANNMDALCLYDRLRKHYQGTSLHAFKQLGEMIERLDFAAAAAQCQALLDSGEAP
ncbi:PAS domain S-box protein [Pseudomonas benzenivorans]|uniref:histidine kinase n=1 Tax=Pseudomonas benzenivorans TaxID=556533 RepID=A0ABY5H8C7_9PSED|nr:PAS domain S-box protein [Pseudomonas benzenivorans]UTW08566.1 PAS domain S-box protein [Pseudomonas benzenivorans]